MRTTNGPIYLDYQATTPTDPRVVEEMLPFFSERFGNPHSTTHEYGIDADRAVARARSYIGALVAASGADITFTSGATEANNLALLGLAEQLRSVNRTHIVTSPIEHSCVKAILEYLASVGFRITVVGVDATGVIDPVAIERALRDDTGLVTVMAVNNEIGTIQPVGALGTLCRARGVLFHTDAAQAAGRIPLDVERMGVDLLTMSAHKLYGPKGVGALYVRGAIRRKMRPILHGGGQERGLRSGTLPAPLCVGFGEACRIATEEMAIDAERLITIRADFLAMLRDHGVRAFSVNGTMDERRIPGNLNIAFDDVDAEALVMRLRPTVAIATGSACTSDSVEPSHVLTSIGLCREAAESSVRISFGRFTTATDILHATTSIAEAVAELRAVSKASSLMAGNR